MPYVWPSATEPECPALQGTGVPLDQMPEEVGTILGIVSAIDHRGATWFETFLAQRSHVQALVIFAVNAGCPTRSEDLNRLLDLQDQASCAVEFRILPMANGPGAPANCLVAIPTDKSASVFMFGPTPNFSIDWPDRTQVNLAFKAEIALFDQWRRWFDRAWLQAAPLTESTADIPALVPASGSPEAAAQWDAYRTLCSRPEQSETDISVNPDTKEIQSGKKADGSEDPPPTIIAELPKLDPLAQRITRLFDAGKQVAIASSSALRPLDVPVDPGLVGQEAEHWDGTVVQRQSFRISVFSKEDLKKIDDYRKGSQAIIKKLGLPLEKGLYWIPDRVVSIFEREIKSKNEEAKKELTKLVDGNAENFMEAKKNKIKEDLTKVYRRLGGKGDLPRRVLTKVMDNLDLRIQRALGAQIVTPVTFSQVSFDLTETEDWQAPWAQAEKLVLALARFPREAISRPNVLSGMETSLSEVLAAMNIVDDEILTVYRKDRLKSEGKAQAELSTLTWIMDARIGGRERCEAAFMVIDGKPSSDIQNFIVDKESAQ